jgi:hypothetical protein
LGSENVVVGDKKGSSRGKNVRASVGWGQGQRQIGSQREGRDIHIGHGRRCSSEILNPDSHANPAIGRENEAGGMCDIFMYARSDVRVCSNARRVVSADDLASAICCSPDMHCQFTLSEQISESL